MPERGSCLTGSPQRRIQATDGGTNTSWEMRVGRCSVLRPFSAALWTPALEHCVAVSRGIWHNLQHVPVLDDFAIVIQAKNIHTRPVSVFVGRPLLMAMQNHVVAFGENSFEVHMLARVLLRHPLEVRNEGFLAIRDVRIVLPVYSARVSLDRLSRLASVEHEVVKLFHRALVSFESIIH